MELIARRAVEFTERLSPCSQEEREPVSAAPSKLFRHFLEPHAVAGASGDRYEAGKIRNIPGVIGRGCYDMICPVPNAVRPAVGLYIIPDAGHAAFQPGITDTLVSRRGSVPQLK